MPRGLLVLACHRDVKARPLLVSHLAEHPIGFSTKHAGAVTPIDSQRAWPGPAGSQASTARWASRAVPLQAMGLAFGLGMAPWAIFRVGPAREVRPI